MPACEAGAFALQLLTENLLTDRSPEMHQWALEKFRGFRSEGQFVPFSIGKDTVVFPGFDGGAEWGGSAFDPETGLLYVNANDIAWIASLGQNKGGSTVEQLYLTNCAGCHRDDMRGTPPEIPSLIDLRGKKQAGEIAAVIRQGEGRMPSFPNLSRLDGILIAEYVLGGQSKELESVGTPVNTPAYRFTGYRKWLDPDGYPAVAPPWGTLNAINPAWLRISMNPATGNGGTCYGDSGGPNFLGNTDVIAATTITGDAVCRAPNVTYRLDTTSARSFLGQFVALP